MTASQGSSNLQVGQSVRVGKLEFLGGRSITASVIGARRATGEAGSVKAIISTELGSVVLVVHSDGHSGGYLIGELEATSDAPVPTGIVEERMSDHVFEFSWYLARDTAIIETMFDDIVRDSPRVSQAKILIASNRELILAAYIALGCDVFEKFKEAQQIAEGWLGILAGVWYTFAGNEALAAKDGKHSVEFKRFVDYISSSKDRLVNLALKEAQSIYQSLSRSDADVQRAIEAYRQHVIRVTKMAIAERIRTT